MSFDEARLADDRRRALAALRDGRRFLLVGHERPDGDVLGSQVALARVLRSLGKTVVIQNPDPAEPHFDTLAPAEEFGVYAGGPLPEHDVAVLLDFSELHRTGPMAPEIARAPSRKLVIDHHLHSGERWWDAAYRDPSAAATGVLVAQIAAELGVELDREAAAGVFTALVSDTGWFRHSNTGAEVFRLAAQLVDAGVEPSTLHAGLYQRRNPESPAVLGQLLSRARYLHGGRVALIDLPLDAGVPEHLAEGDGALDVLRSVEGLEMALYVWERRPSHWRLSARAKGDAQVHGLALRFGGGGHRKAAGATILGERDDVLRRLELAVAQELESAHAGMRAGGPA